MIATSRRHSLLLGITLLAMAGACSRSTAPAPGTTARHTPGPGASAWLERSNQHTQYVLDNLARLTPEFASQVGIDGYDDQIRDLSAGYVERSRAALAQVLGELEQRLASETDPLVRQDLEILIESQRQELRELELDEKYELPYFNVPQMVFQSVRVLLDDQAKPERRKAALVRLRKYTGMEPGFVPIVQHAMERTRERLGQPGLLAPVKDELERDLGNIRFFLEGLPQLFQKYQIAGYEEPMARLATQLGEYERFVRAELMPRARADFRLPAEVYAFRLEKFGVDLPGQELAAQARAAFQQIQAEMQTIAAQVARARGWQDSDYRAVIRNLKKEQIVGEAILPHYQQRLAEIEAIIRRERLVTLPGRPARIRLATVAESAQQPAPNMRPPRLLGNTGEQGEFVLPLSIPAADPSKVKQYDDFTFAAASWTLTAHEARPGHEMQFAGLVEQGVSAARAIFAFNSVNVEGWALYAEYILKPHMPLEGQLISLQHRLLRAARAYCDPELQLGKLTPAQVKQILMNDVVLSEAMATQEVERYTFRNPGQATSYFHGYTKLVALRAEVEQTMGTRFEAQAFHDFILAQGLLPPRLLRKAVLDEFVGQPAHTAQLGAGSRAASGALSGTHGP